MRSHGTDHVLWRKANLRHTGGEEEADVSVLAAILGHVMPGAVLLLSTGTGYVVLPQLVVCVGVHGPFYHGGPWESST